MFINLNVRSDFSLLSSTMKVQDIIKKSLEEKQPAIALTDSNNLCGALEFAEYALQNGIQPIIGVTIYISNLDVEGYIILLAKNQLGYKVLIDICIDSFNSTMDWEVVINNKQRIIGNLICLTGTMLQNLVFANAKYDEFLTVLQDIFGEDLFIEVQRQGLQVQVSTEYIILEMATKFNISIVATNPTLFLDKNFALSHKVLRAISYNERLINQLSYYHENDEYSFKNYEDVCNIFSDIPDAISNTEIIAKKCIFFPESLSPVLPFFSDDAEGDLERDSYEGLYIRLGGSMLPEYEERLLFELDVIKKMGYAGYFLIVADFVKWSKANSIMVGPGRGSGVGSIVAWALQITELDPIKYHLLFERFLNPDRVSMPDFDIDFCQEKRAQVIKYIEGKYRNVAHIATFGKMQTRAVLRDVGRVMEIPYMEIDKICKMVPNNPANPVNLSDAIAMDPELQKHMKEDSYIAMLIEVSLKLEGLYRHISIHAAGIVISDEDLKNFLPIFYEDGNSMPITQYSMKYVEKSGLIKFDFLGLKTLTIISQACDMVRNHNKEFDINKVPIDDKETYQLLSSGMTIGVFQLESPFMQETLSNLSPDCIGDIIALISLNRPGPIDNIPVYIARKNGREDTVYIHEKLSKVLYETFGVVIYQEQVMQMAQILANYTLAEADILRRAMGKKDRKEMTLQKSKFIEGAEKNGICDIEAEKLFDLVEKFAGYGFNKSHAAAYALISYQTAFLKANYPVEFFVASMNIDINDTVKLNYFCNDARKFNINIVPSNIKYSSAFFKPQDLGSIVYGIGALKRVGNSAASEIEKYSGDNVSLEMFIKNTRNIINKKALESLIKFGYFDILGYKRSVLLYNIEHILDYKSFETDVGVGSNAKNNTKVRQNSLFAEYDSKNIIIKIENNDMPELGYQSKAENEFESIGFYLFHHPILPIREKFYNIDDYCLFCVIDRLIFKSRNNERFVILICSDEQDNYTFSFYGEALIIRYKDLLKIGMKVVLYLDSNRRRILNIMSLEEFFYSSAIFNKDNVHMMVLNAKAVSELKASLKIDLERGLSIVLFGIDDNKLKFEAIIPMKYELNFSKLLEIDDIKFILHNNILRLRR